jgi:hypothetical protein
MIETMREHLAFPAGRLRRCRQRLIVLVLGAAVMTAGCANGEGSAGGALASAPAQAAGPATSPEWKVTRTAVVDLPSHVHALVVRRDGALLVGAHEGLFVLAATGKATRVSEHAFDVMGLARGGSTTLLASGHPAPHTPGPNPLGLVSSDDGGRTWRSVSLAGEADLHLIAADDRRVVATTAATCSRRPTAAPPGRLCARPPRPRRRSAAASAA